MTARLGGTGGTARVSTLEWLPVAALLAALTFMSLRDGAVLGPGIDEIAHIGAAYDLAASGENRLNPEHPPLVKLASGWAMRWHQGDRFGDRLPVGVATGEWQMGRAVLYPEQRLDRTMLLIARLPILLVALLGGVAVWGWSRALFGAQAALFSLALYALSPTTVAHSIFVITDLPLGVFALCAAWLSWEAARRGSARWALLGGAAAGLACMTKYSGPLALGTTLALMFALPAPASEGLPRQRVRLLVCFGAGAALAALLVGGLHVGGDYAAGMGQLYYNIRPTYPAYALGAVSLTGFWYYFPLEFLLKSTIPELLVALGVLVALAWPGRVADSGGGARQRLATAGWLLLFPLAYAIALVLAGRNFGHRYLVPMYPFLFVAAGAIWARWNGLAARALLASLVLAQAWAGWRAAPDPLSYFNGLLGCEGKMAAFCLDDSNVDWGQNLPRVAAIVSSRLVPGEAPIVGTQTLDFMPLGAHFPNAEVLTHDDWFHPRPALYAVSGQVLIRYAIQDPKVQQSPLFAALLRGEGVGNSWLVADLRTRAAADAAPTQPR